MIFFAKNGKILAARENCLYCILCSRINVAFELNQELFILLALGGFKSTKFINNVIKVKNNLSPPENGRQQGSKNTVNYGHKSSHVLGLN